MNQNFRRAFWALLLSVATACMWGCGSSENFVFTQNTVNPVQGVPTQLTFQTVPARVAGTTFNTINVAVLDSNDQVVTTATNPVTIALSNPGLATLSGTTTVDAVNGVASFSDLSVDLVGDYSFVASSPGLDGATSANFTITPSSFTQLSFLQQPGNINIAAPFNPAVQVEARDAQGNLVTDAVDVTIVIGTDPATGSVLGGTTMATTVNGVATFPGLTVSSGSGAGFVLQAQATGAQADSDSFNVQSLFLFTDITNNRVAQTEDFTGTNFASYNGSNTGSSFTQSTRSTVDAQGRIYTTDIGRVVRVDDISGTNPVAFNTLGGLTGFGIGVDSTGRIYVSFVNNGQIHRYDDMTGANPVALVALAAPDGLDIDSSDRIYFAERGANRVVRIDNIAGGNMVTVNPGLSTPTDVALDSAGRIYISSNANNRIYRVDDMAGTNPLFFATGGGNVLGVDVDAAGRVYTALSSLDVFRRFDDMTGANPVDYGTTGAGNNQYNDPFDVHVFE
jgi:sugar lactone lactonase YvrE